MLLSPVKRNFNKYLLLTVFEGRTLSRMEPRISHRTSRLDHKSKGKNERFVTYSTDNENEVSKIFIVSNVCLTSSRMTSIHAERLQVSDTPQKQFEIVVTVVTEWIFVSRF